MGLFRALKSLVSPQAMGEEVVDAQYRTYQAAAIRTPQAEPHELLADTLLARWAAKGINVNNEEVQ